MEKQQDQIRQGLRDRYKEELDFILKILSRESMMPLTRQKITLESRVKLYFKPLGIISFFTHKSINEN